MKIKNFWLCQRRKKIIHLCCNFSTLFSTLRLTMVTLALSQFSPNMANNLMIKEITNPIPNPRPLFWNVHCNRKSLTLSFIPINSFLQQPKRKKTRKYLINKPISHELIDIGFLNVITNTFLQTRLYMCFLNPSRAKVTRMQRFLITISTLSFGIHSR